MNFIDALKETSKNISLKKNHKQERYIGKKELKFVQKRKKLGKIRPKDIGKRPKGQERRAIQTTFFVKVPKSIELLNKIFMLMYKKTDLQRSYVVCREFLKCYYEKKFKKIIRQECFQLSCKVSLKQKQQLEKIIFEDPQLKKFIFK